MWRIDYYVAPSGRRPVAEWLGELDKNISAHMQDKVVQLEQYGLVLLDTSMMKPIKGDDSDFYELK